MTVIAFDGRTLAADRSVVNNGLASTATKIHRVGSLLCGGSGCVSSCNAMLDWVRGGRDPKAFPAGQVDPKGDWSPFLVIEADGQILLYDNNPFPTRYDRRRQRFYAIGSGRDYAMAAMYLGCDAKRAVNVASALEVGCGNGVDVLRLGDAR